MNYNEKKENKLVCSLYEVESFLSNCTNICDALKISKIIKKHSIKLQ